MTDGLVIVLDCGATNVRAAAVDTSGHIVAKAQESNQARPAQEEAGWLIWPYEDIFQKLCLCVNKVTTQVSAKAIKALTVTSFGVDGTFLDAQESLLHPVISWKCPRTVESHQHLHRYLDPAWCRIHSGVFDFSPNTLYKFIWFLENQPDIVQRARHWLFISSLINHSLTGCLTTDATMAGTSQMTSLSGQSFSQQILDALQLEHSLFPRTVWPGDPIGTLQADAARKMSLPEGIPVISSGHDTQCALFGSGADIGQPVLSSGTWEVLMVRMGDVSHLSSDFYQHNLTCEWDAVRGFYNPGSQWLASGVLEWIGHQFFSDVVIEQRHQRMIKEASRSQPDCGGVRFDPSFMPDDQGMSRGAITGLSLQARRGDIYRAALEALSGQLRDNLQVLQRVVDIQADHLIIAGGGSKNNLWNQVKANTLQLPVKVVEQPETTVMGAAMFAMYGAGLFSSPEQARESSRIQYSTVYPEP